jgi:hypothetical protein
MSDYPSTSPFGPHGPQVPANSVTPNPTAYTPPTIPSPISFGQPAAPTGYPGPYAGTGGTVAAGPRRKSMVLAIILSVCLGPFGLIYSAMSRQYMSTLFFMGGSVLAMLWLKIPWSPFVIISVIWSVIAVNSYNNSLTKS